MSCVHATMNIPFPCKKYSKSTQKVLKNVLKKYSKSTQKRLKKYSKSLKRFIFVFVMYECVRSEFGRTSVNLTK